VAPLPDVPKVIRTSLIHDYGSDLDVVTRFYTRFSGTNPTDAELSTFNALVGGLWFSDLAPYANSAVSLQTTQSTDLTTVTGAQSEDTTIFDGSRGGHILPASAAAVVGYEIGRRYRGGHSRGYWPFGSDTDVSSPQVWDPMFVSAFAGAVQSFFSDVAGSGWGSAGTLTHVNVSYFHGFTVVINPSTGRARNVPTVRPSPLIDTVLTYAGRSRIGSQRRRTG
jgi:hypothetical protein